jgi:hypothetical protein
VDPTPLHWPARVVSPGTGSDILQSAASGGKESVVPLEQARCCQRLVELLRGIEHHFHDAFNLAICWKSRDRFNPQLAGK